VAESFQLAPPAHTVDGLLAVPVDIETIEASFVFDATTQTASADATLTYTVGPSGGHPIFDLRQTITQAWLDGAPFPVARLAHHTFGQGSFTDLRVIEAEQSAGSRHTLRVQYVLGVPDAQLGAGYLPALAWDPGPRLRLVFGLSALNRGRYVEGWLPANLLFDQFGIRLELRILGAGLEHTALSNGAVTVLGENHWSIEFPSHFTALSPMLEVRASDTLEGSAADITLPVSGQHVRIEAWKPVASSVDLGSELGRIQGLLAANEHSFGPYQHGGRFLACFDESGGMAYEGGTTTSSAALPHEAFHSWFARGIKPASHADGWWGEAFTAFRADAESQAIPFDFSDPPVVLCSRDPWQRHTPAHAGTDGASFWKGMAALLGSACLDQLMAELYAAHRGHPVSTQMIEELLLAKSGNPSVVDAFHRFVYGLADPSPLPELWIRDAVEDPGADHWAGTFWDSPDVWVRHQDDGGTSHQSPRSGQDNWLHARVRNRARAGHAAHFVVSFRTRGFSGSQFTYPADFFPCTAAKAEFDLAPGEWRVVKARWPRALVPAPGEHSCLLASVIARSDHPAPGRHVWEHNNLAQKNLTSVELAPGSSRLLPVVLGNSFAHGEPQFELEVLLPTQAPVEVSLLHTTREFFRESELSVVELTPGSFQEPPVSPRSLDCSGSIGGPEAREGAAGQLGGASAARFARGWELTFPKGPAPKLPITITPFSQTVVGLKLTAPVSARPANPFKVHLVQRNRRTRQIVGGVAVEVLVKAS
jgi:hypothetical protein